MAEADQSPSLKELEDLAESRGAPPKLSLRARIVLGAIRGETNRDVARRLGVTAPTVALWRGRYDESGIAGLRDRPRTGRPRLTAARGQRGRSPEDSSSGRPGEAGFATHLTEAQVRQLLEAASRTIADRGFGAARVSDIAEAAGVSPATIHYHFKTKEEVLIQALLWMSGRLTSDLDGLGSDSDDAGAELAKFIERTIPYPGARRDEYLLEIELWSQIRLRPELLDSWESYCARWIAHVAGIIRAGAEASRFNPVDEPEEVAERLVALTDGLGIQAATGAARMAPERAHFLVLRFAAQQLGVEYEVFEPGVPTQPEP